LKRKAGSSQPGKSDFGAEAPPYKKVSSTPLRCAPKTLANAISNAQKIEHAGYYRYILRRNPPRYDPDGDIVEYGDEYEDEEDLTTIEENPYADIHLESEKRPNQLTGHTISNTNLRSPCASDFGCRASHAPLYVDSLHLETPHTFDRRRGNYFASRAERALEGQEPSHEAPGR
jgi:hypothetical protein